jgi:hypothetical protein
VMPYPMLSMPPLPHPYTMYPHAEMISFGMLPMEPVPYEPTLSHPTLSYPPPPPPPTQPQPPRMSKLNADAPEFQPRGTFVWQQQQQQQESNAVASDVTPQVEVADGENGTSAPASEQASEVMPVTSAIKEQIFFGESEDGKIEVIRSSLSNRQLPWHTDPTARVVLEHRRKLKARKVDRLRNNAMMVVAQKSSEDASTKSVNDAQTAPVQPPPTAPAPATPKSKRGAKETHQAKEANQTKEVKPAVVNAPAQDKPKSSWADVAKKPKEPTRSPAPAANPASTTTTTASPSVNGKTATTPPAKATPQVKPAPSAKKFKTLAGKLSEVIWMDGIAHGAFRCDSWLQVVIRHAIDSVAWYDQ